MPPIQIQPTGRGGRMRRAQREVRQAQTDFETTLSSLTDGWSGLSAAAKTDALRAGVVLCLRVARLVIEQTKR